MASRNPRQSTGQIAAVPFADETPTFNVPDDAPEVVEAPLVVTEHGAAVAAILPVDPPKLPEPIKAVSTFDEQGQAIPVEQLAAENPDEQFFHEDGTPVEVKDPDLVSIKILGHGVTAGGQVYNVGQVVQFNRRKGVFRSTVDRKGNSWLDLSAADQIARYGEVKWRIV